MSSALPIRAALTRGAIVTLANWPVVLIEFVVESAYKAALGVPILGGAFMVALLLGVDVRSLLGEGLVSAADQILLRLATAPAALAAFLAALSIVGVGGAMTMYVVKAGTLSVLVRGERTAGELYRRPSGFGIMREATAYSLASLWDAVRHFERRAATLAFWLGLSYVAIGGGTSWSSAGARGWRPIRRGPPPASAGARRDQRRRRGSDGREPVIRSDACRGRHRRLRRPRRASARARIPARGCAAGARHLWRDGIDSARRNAASITATAGLALVAWVPLAGLLFVPLQVAFWIVRGLLFEYMGLVTLSAYQTQYRRFATPQIAPVESARRMTHYDSFFSQSAGHMRESAIRQTGAVLAQATDMISFAPGYPAEGSVSLAGAGRDRGGAAHRPRWQRPPVRADARLQAAARGDDRADENPARDEYARADRHDDGLAARARFGRAGPAGPRRCRVDGTPVVRGRD
jgi:hypothetical protein